MNGNHPITIALKRNKMTQDKRNPQKRRKSHKPIKTRLKSIKKLIKEADRLFSLIVRRTNADKEGICTCFTCGYRAPLARVQMGHFISRWYKIIRWHIDNVRVQCWVCNIYKKGDSQNFRQRLLKEIGAKRVAFLESECSKKFKLTREFLEAKIQEFKNQL